MNGGRRGGFGGRGGLGGMPVTVTSQDPSGPWCGSVRRPGGGPWPYEAVGASGSARPGPPPAAPDPRPAPAPDPRPAPA
ncbi:translation initiation factor IF-2, partial [Streptomyces sp. NPDC059193]